MKLMFALISWIFLLQISITGAEQLTEDYLSKMPESAKNRAGKFLFSIVQFPNSACKSVIPQRSGTCYTISECETKKGLPAGSCAAGFGVCCVIIMTAPLGNGRSSDSIAILTENGTYIQNQGYPSPTVDNLSSCSFSVTPLKSDICQLRLDFVNFFLIRSGADCSDKFTVSSPTGRTYEPLCGNLTGQHMYVETGLSASPSMLDFSLDPSATGDRSWMVKVSQIECSNPSKAPEDCTQYFTGCTGKVQNYNFGQMLKSQNYVNCFRQELGYCQIEFAENTSLGSQDSFYLSSNGGAKVGPDCSSVNSAIIIPNDQRGNTLYCGGHLNPISGDTMPGVVRVTKAPFTLGVVSTESVESGSTGFCLIYTQVPC